MYCNVLIVINLSMNRKQFKKLKVAHVFKNKRNKDNQWLSLN